MAKKLLCALLALTALLSLGAALAEANLLQNGDFSEWDGDQPVGWRKEMWLTDAGISLLTAEEDGYDGGCACVTNVDANDARFAQTVAVEPDTLYRISGMIRAEDCDTDGYGASLSVEDVFVYTDAVYDTGGDWEFVELYGRTGADQTTLTVFARVGGYGTLARGRAWFDDIAVEEVEAVPAGYAENLFYREASPAADSGASDDGEPARNTEGWLLFTCAYALAVLGFARKRERAAQPLAGSKLTAAFVAGLVIAFVARIVLAVRVRGYYVDINCFTGWSERMFANGPANFYAPDYFCDYPPGYMLLLWFVGALRRLFGLRTDGAAYIVLLKLLPILADIAGAALVWRVARRRLPERAAMALGLLAAFNPAAMADSAAWGQIDAVLALLIALCALEAVDGNTIPALMLFGVALLVKPQALLFAPIGLTAIICGVVRAEGADRAKRLRDLLVGTAACLGLLYGFAFVMCLGQPGGFGQKLVRPVTWLIELYSGSVQGYRYITVNTLNLYNILGLNWARAEDHAAVNAVAWALLALSYAGCIALTVAGTKKPRRLFLTGGLLIVLVCAFGPMIHERYVFPGMLLLLLAYACERDWRILASLTALTCTLFLNEILVLQGGMTAANYGHLQDSERWLNVLVSAASLLNAGFLAWTAADICLKGHVMAMRAPQREALPAGEATLGEDANYRMNLRRIDAILMAAVTLAYGVLAFVNLGTTAAPQTDWVSSISGEAVVFDLGGIEDWRMTYYGGICNSTFGVELSNDGENWTEKVYAQYDQGQIFRWLWFVPSSVTASGQSVIYRDSEPAEGNRAAIAYASGDDAYPMQRSRYVRVTAESAGLVLYEIGFLDESGAPLTVSGVSQSGQNPDTATSAARLIDEQRTVPDHPSYLNSSYFDEIYHARTAFEHLHGLTAYEWTHPPLGKVTMMLGIQIFGMTPFGWRFMGALAGVAMVPLMYLLVKQLTKSTKLSFIAMCLMALDSMHFTQTRIATIDSYAVLWIMVMYLFMFRYCQMSWNRESLGRTLVPLGLCGVTMGVAWATKWIGLYASAGLAILFFWTLFRRLREGRHLRGGGQTARNTCVTLLFCVLFFMVIPALIYYFSYYWLLRPEGVRNLGDMFSAERVNRVIELQKSIFGYHAGLAGDTHFFRSPWYQWPVIWWPMWYYSGTAYLPEGMISSISCMGNPAVWWFGLAALLFVIARMCWVRRAPKRYVMVVIAFASQFLPWVLVPRSTFIYHYFASVPFIIIASALLLEWIETRSKKAFQITSGALLGAALILFGMFYPLESGLPCARSYAKVLRWFKWYNY